MARVLNTSDGMPVSDINPLPVIVKGDTLVESKTSNDLEGNVLTFSGPIEAIGIYVTGAMADPTFTVNGIPIHIPPNILLRAVIGGTPSNIVTVSGATTFIFNRYI